MPSIDILCAIGTNSSLYAEYLKATAEKLSTTNCDIKWKCMLGLDRNQLYEEPKGFINYGKGKSKNDHGSVNHACTMHELMLHSNADITIIADVDIAILKKGWDQDVLDHLEKYDSFGIEWGKWDRKYANFPSIMFIAFRTELLQELNWDLKPETKTNTEGIERYSANKLDAEVCSVPEDFLMKKDSGWKIPYFFKEKGKTGYGVKKVKVGSKLAQLPFKNKAQKKICIAKPTHMSEYLLNGELFASHLQASRSKPFYEENASAWRWRCDEFIKNKYGI